MERFAVVYQDIEGADQSVCDTLRGYEGQLQTLEEVCTVCRDLGVGARLVDDTGHTRGRVRPDGGYTLEHAVT